MTPKDQDQPKPVTEEEKEVRNPQTIKRLQDGLLKWREYTKTPEGKKTKEELDKALQPVLDLMHPQPEDMERREK